MKRPIHTFIRIGTIICCMILKLILDIVTTAMLSFRLGFLFDFAAIALGIALAKVIIEKYEKKRFDTLANLINEDVPADIIKQCETFEGNNNILKNYLDTCFERGKITQDQFNSLYNTYSDN